MNILKAAFSISIYDIRTVGLVMWTAYGCVGAPQTPQGRGDWDLTQKQNLRGSQVH